MNRKASFAALLGVVAVSIVFGMILGGRLNAPPVMHAARDTAAGGSFPAASGPGAGAVSTPDFSVIAENALPAVVGVQNTSVNKGGDDEQGGDDDGGPQFDDPMFRFFFGPPNRRGGPRAPQQPQRKVSSGSGFIVTDDGYILTNNHVVEGATKLQVTLDTGEKYNAKVIGTDPMIDLGLIKIDAKGKKLPTLPLGDSASVKIGQWVMAIGNPLGLERTVTVGVVSGKKRQVGVSDVVVPGLANFIQTDAAINFGNSGGPLLDGQGRVVGINTAIFRGELAEGIGFAIPIDEARKAAEELKSGGAVKRGYLGVGMSSAAIDARVRDYYKLPDDNGVLVADVTPGTPASRAGLRKGDVIRRLDGEVVKDNQDLQFKVASHKPDDTVKLEVIREGKTVTVDVKLGTRPVKFDASGAGSEPDTGGEGSTGESVKGLGIKVQSIPPALREHLGLSPSAAGVMVLSVDPESDAADAGLVPQTIIVSVNDAPVRDIADWNRAVKGLKPGETAKIEILVAKDRTDSIFVTVPSSSSK